MESTADGRWEWSTVDGTAAVHERAMYRLRGDIKDILHVLRSVRGFGSEFNDILITGMTKLSILSAERENQAALLHPQGFRALMDTMEVCDDDVQVQEAAMVIVESLLSGAGSMTKELLDHLQALIATVWRSIARFYQSELLCMRAAAMLLALINREERKDLADGTLARNAVLEEGRGMQLILKMTNVHKSSDDLRTRVARLLCKLSPHSECGPFIAEFGGLQIIVTAGEQRSTDIAFTKLSLGALAVLTRSKMIALEVLALEGANYATRMIQQWTDPEVRASAATILRNLTKCTHNLPEILSMEIIQNIMTVLRGGLKDPNVTETCLGALEHTCGTPEGRRMLNREGGLQFVVQSVVQHAKVPEVVSLAWSLVSIVGKNSEINCEVMVNEGILQLLIDSLEKKDARDMTVGTLCILRAALILCQTWHGCVNHCIRLGLIPVLIAQLRAYKDEKLELGMSILSLVVTEIIHSPEIIPKEDKKEFVGGLADSIAELVKTSKSNVQVESAAMVLLERLFLAFGHDSLNLPDQVGIAQAIIACMAEYSSDTAIQTGGANLLKQILIGAENVAEETASAGGEMLVMALQLHAVDREVIASVIDAIAAYCMWNTAKQSISVVLGLEGAGMFVIDTNIKHGKLAGRISVLFARILSDVGPRADVDSAEMLRRFTNGLELYGNIPDITILFAQAIHAVTYSKKNQLSCIGIGVWKLILEALRVHYSNPDVLVPVVLAAGHVATPKENAAEVFRTSGLLDTLINVSQIYIVYPNVLYAIAECIGRCARSADPITKTSLAVRCVLYLINGIKKTPSDSRLICACLRALAGLSENEAMSLHEMCSLGIVDIIYLVLRAHRGDFEVLISCCNCCAALSTDANSAAILLKNKGILNNAFTTISSSVNNSDIQIAAMEMFSAMMVYPESREDLVSRGAVPLILKVLRRYWEGGVTSVSKSVIIPACISFSRCIAVKAGMDLVEEDLNCISDFVAVTSRMHEHADILKVLFLALGNICSLPSNATKAISFGLIDITLEIMKRHFLDGSVLVSACGCLFNLTTEDTATLDFFKRGGVRFILQLLGAYGTHEELTSAALMVLLNCSFVVITRPAIVKYHGIRTLIQAIKTFSRNMDLRSYAFGVICNVCKNPELRKSVTDTDIIMHTVGVLRERSMHSKMQAAALGVVFQLSLDDDNIQIFVEEQAIAAVSDVVESLQRDKPVVENGVGCLRNFFARGLHRHAQAAGSFEVILKAMSRHITTGAILAFGAAALYGPCRESDYLRKKMLQGGLAGSLISAIVSLPSVSPLLVEVATTAVALAELPAALEGMTSHGAHRAIATCLSAQGPNADPNLILNLLILTRKLCLASMFEQNVDGVQVDADTHRLRGAGSKATDASETAYTLLTMRWIAGEWRRNRATSAAGSGMGTLDAARPISSKRGQRPSSRQDGRFAQRPVSRSETRFDSGKRPDTADASSDTGESRPQTAGSFVSEHSIKQSWVKAPKVAAERDAGRQRLIRTATDWDGLFNACVRAIKGPNVKLRRVSWETLASLIPLRIFKDSVASRLPEVFLDQIEEVVSDTDSFQFAVKAVAFFAGNEECRGLFADSMANPIPVICATVKKHLLIPVVAGSGMALLSYLTQSETLAEVLMEQKGIELALDSLRAHPFAHRVSIHASGVIANVADSNEEAMNLLAGGDNCAEIVGTLLQVVADHISEATAVSSVELTLMLMTRTGAASRPFVEKGGVGIVLSAMRHHVTEPSVQEFGCLLLANIASYAIASQLIMDGGVVLLVTDALTAHISDNPVVLATLALLGELVSLHGGMYAGDVANPKLATLTAGAVIEYKLEDRDVNSLAMRTLAGMTSYKKDAFGNFIEGVRLVVYIFAISSQLVPEVVLAKPRRTDPPAYTAPPLDVVEEDLTGFFDGPTQLNAATTLSNIVSNGTPTVTDTVSDLGSIRLLLVIARRHRKDANLAHHIFVILAGLVTTPTAMAQMTRENTIDACIHALTDHFAIKPIIRNVCNIVKVMFSNSQNQARFCREHGVPPLLVVLKRTKAEKKVLVAALEAAANLGKDPWARKVLRRHGALEIIGQITPELRQHKAIDEAVVNATKIITKEDGEEDEDDEEDESDEEDEAAEVPRQSR